MTDLTVAETILAQLGGNRFRAMTGAKDLVGGTRMLQMRVGRNDKGVNLVRVTLDENDTYRVEGFKVRNFDVKRVSEAAGIYCDMLRDAFTAATGLRCAL